MKESYRKGVANHLAPSLALLPRGTHPSVEPFLDQPYDAWVGDAMLHELDQPTLVEVIEKSSNVGIKNVVHLLPQEHIMV